MQPNCFSLILTASLTKLIIFSFFTNKSTISGTNSNSDKLLYTFLPKIYFLFVTGLMGIISKPLFFKYLAAKLLGLFSLSLSPTIAIDLVVREFL